ncbi:MAG: hypothetical protein KDN20_10325 [Verrucomicrobiae bacterium]|nr:hypothetical protein [Verrucomicrobiae bacterium]
MKPFRISLLLILAVSVLGFRCLAEEKPEPTSIALGADRHLFLDDSLIDPLLSRNVTRQINPPQDFRRILKPEMPWEALGFIFYASVVDHEGTAMLYYGCYDDEKKKHLCLATSQDGLQWERPDLKLLTYRGTTENNLFPLEAVEAGVFLDPMAPPEKRFRLLHNRYWPDPKKAGVYLSSSADGIHWKQSETRLLPLVPDSQPSAYWDPIRKTYAIFLRAWDPKRSIGRVETANLETPWPYDTGIPPFHVWGQEKVATVSRELPIVMRPNNRDPANLHLYTSTTFRYPWAENAYLAFPAAYFLFPKDEGLNGNDGTFDIQLAVSRDGIDWERFQDTPWVKPETLDGVALRLVSMGTGMIRRGNELHQYFIAWPYTHGRPVVWDRDLEDRANWLKKDLGGIYCATSRRDGFVSIDAEENKEAVFTSKPLTFQGSQLTLNLKTEESGAASIAFLNAEGKAIPGFGHADSPEIHGDSTEFPVTWKSGHDLKELSGQTVRLQVKMRDAKLFAIEFAR